MYDLIDLYALYKYHGAIASDLSLIGFHAALAEDAGDEKAVQMWVARDDQHHLVAVAGALEEEPGTVYCHIRWFNTPKTQRYKLYIKGINKFQTELERQGYLVRYSMEESDEGVRLLFRLADRKILKYLGLKKDKHVFKKRGKK